MIQVGCGATKTVYGRPRLKRIPVRIGFFSDRYLPFTDGIACSMEDARRELEARGHEVYIFAPKPNRRYREASPRITRFPAVKGLFFDDYRCSLFYPPRARRHVDTLDLDRKSVV